MIYSSIYSIRDGGKCNLSPSDGGDSVPKFVLFLDRDGCCYRSVVESTWYTWLNWRERISCLMLKNHGSIRRHKKDKEIQESGWTRKIDGKFAEKQGQTNISRDNDDFIPINCVFSTKGYSDCVFRRCIVSKFRFQFANQKRGPWYKIYYIRKKLRCIDHWIKYNIKVVKNHMKNNYNKDGFEQKTNKWQTNIKHIII